MARKAAGRQQRQEGPRRPDHMGKVILENLARFGLVELAPKTKEIAAMYEKVHGRRISRQRISAIVKAPRVEDETVADLEKAIGAKPGELTREP